MLRNPSVPPNSLSGAASREPPGGSGPPPTRSSVRWRWRAASLGLGAVYCWMAVQLPIWVLANGLHDDALFVRLGRELAEGRWFGAYDETTLMKGPGYPLLLALNAWLGLPLSLTQALLHCAAAAAVGWLVSRLGGSRGLGLAVGLALLMLPVALEAPLRRIVRDAVYIDQVLLALVAWGAALGVARTSRERIGTSAVAGLATGWVWLSREEGLWLLPMLFIGVGAATLAVRGAAVPFRRSLAVVMTVAAAGFLVVTGAFRLGNLVHYGRWVGVEIHDRDFRRALAALQSVQAGDPIPFVPVTRAAREAIYGVSPSFAAIRAHLDPATGPVWQAGCDFYPETCGEIAGGWFLWALRAASAQAGFHASATDAAAHYRRVAGEVEAACDRGALRCRARRGAFVPPISRTQVARAPGRVAQAARCLALRDRGPVAIAASRGPRAEYERMLDFVRGPASLPLEGETSRVWMNGWYHQRGRAWFRAYLERTDGSIERLRIDRLPSPGLVEFFGDPRAVRQRFEAEGTCDPSCTVVLVGDGGGRARVPLARIAGGGRGLPVGRGGVHFDAVEVESPGQAELPRTRAEVVLAGLRWTYRLLLAPTLAAGLIAFGAALVFAARDPRGRPMLALAAAAWCGVATRIALVVAIDLTSFPAVRLQYLAVAMPLALVAALLSIALAARRLSAARRPISAVPGAGSSR